MLNVVADFFVFDFFAFPFGDATLHAHGYVGQQVFAPRCAGGHFLDFVECVFNEVSVLPEAYGVSWVGEFFGGGFVCPFYFNGVFDVELVV